MRSTSTRDWVFAAGVCLARAAFGFQFQSLATLAPDLVARFGLDYATLGTLIGLYMAPGIVVALPGGFAGRRWGERAAVGCGLVCMVAGFLLPLALLSPGTVGAGRLLAGTGAVLLVVMQGKMVADRFTGRRFLPVMSVLVGAFPVGAGLAGLSHDWLVPVAGPAGMFAAGAALAAAGLLLFLPTAAVPAASAAPGWSLPSAHECRLVGVAGLVWTAYNAAYYGFLSYMPSLMAARGHTPAEAATTMMAATWTNLPAIVVGGILATRFGTGPVLLLGTLSAAAALLGAAGSDWPLAWALLFGTLGSVHPGIIVALGTLSARPANQAVGMGLFYTVYYAGGTVLPPLFGAAADRAGSPAGALAAAAALSLLALPAFLLHRTMDHPPR